MAGARSSELGLGFARSMQNSFVWGSEDLVRWIACYVARFARHIGFGHRAPGLPLRFEGGPVSPPAFRGRERGRARADSTRVELIIQSWKPKQPETNGCSNMAIEILYIGNGCLGKHPFVSGCLVSQDEILNKYQYLDPPGVNGHPESPLRGYQ